MSDYLNELKWDAAGLIPVMTQDAQSGRNLMLAWVNREALSCAIAEGRAVYWSRSRSQLWRKGEESGNVQELVGVYLDCDGDALCYVVKQIGGIACHTGRESCFYRKLENNQWVTTDDVLKNPEDMYQK